MASQTPSRIPEPEMIIDDSQALAAASQATGGGSHHQVLLDSQVPPYNNGGNAVQHGADGHGPAVIHGGAEPSPVDK